MRHYLAFVLLSTVFAAAATGTIRGTVLDEHGAPVKHLVLNYEEQLDNPSVTGCCRQTETDDNGHFSIQIVIKREENGTTSGGKWVLYPHFEDNDSAGSAYYPPPRVPFYRTDHGNTNVQVIDLTPEAPDAVIEIKLGPKAGALTGQVTDAVTGAPIKPYASVAVAWASDPRTFIGTNTGSTTKKDPSTGQWKEITHGKYRILVPPDTELTVKAFTIAKGYKPHQYQGVIEIGSGEDKVLDIQLQPEDK